MGSEDNKRKKKSRKKEKDRKRKRSRERSSSSESSESKESNRRRKKIRKRSEDDTRVMPAHKQYPLYPPIPPGGPYQYPGYMGHMGHHMGPMGPMGMMNPPPPMAQISSMPKINKTKQSNIFKILPSLSWAPIMFSNTILDPELLGVDNYEKMILKMWKSLEKKTKVLNIERVRKLVVQGLSTHQKLASALKSKPESPLPEPRLKFSDFEILQAIYNNKPLSEIHSMSGPENTVRLPPLNDQV